MLSEGSFMQAVQTELAEGETNEGGYKDERPLSMFSCHANCATPNIAQSCLMSKAEWIVEQLILKDAAKDDLENHRILWNLQWMSK